MIGCIIQARMGSTRLPGKVMREVDGKNPALFYTVNQIQSCKLIDKIVIATTDLNEDSIIVNYVKKLNVEYFQGSSEDVLDRCYQCAKKFGFSTIIRLTADNILIDPEIVDNAIKLFQNNNYDYITNELIRTFPQGIFVEILSFKTIENVWKNANLPSEREHVTTYIKNHKEKFNIFNIENSINISHFRLTIDTIDDLKLVKKIIAKIKHRPILMKDILDLFSREPELISINKNYILDEGYKKSLKKDKLFLNSNKKLN